MKNTRTTACWTVLALFAAALCTPAEAYSGKVRKACAGDYQSYCSQYAPGSSQVRRCFESNRKGLTQWCISALIEAGEVPSKYRRK